MQRLRLKPPPSVTIEARHRWKVGGLGALVHASRSRKLIPDRFSGPFSGFGEAASGWLTPLDEVSLPDATVPPRTVVLGAVPLGVDESQVAYGGSARWSDEGTYAGSIETSPEDEVVWVRACLGDACGPPWSTER